jgi:hypothetical protein
MTARSARSIERERDTDDGERNDAPLGAAGDDLAGGVHP